MLHKELETQVEISQMLGFISSEQSSPLENDIVNVRKMLTKLIQSLKQRPH